MADSFRSKKQDEANPQRETSSRKAVLAPVIAGLLLDALDLATYGPIGLWAGLAVGGLAGYFLAASMGVAQKRRLGYAAVAGVYCMMPFTAFLPVATVLGTLIQLREGDPPDRPDDDPKPVIEAEYRSRWDED